MSMRTIIRAYAKQQGVAVRWFHKLPLIGNRLLMRDITRDTDARLQEMVQRFWNRGVKP